MSVARPLSSCIALLPARGGSPLAFSGETIPEATLLGFLEAAHWAPTCLPDQPWRFICGRRETPAWQAIFDSLADYNRSWAQRASALVLVLSTTQARWPLHAHSFDDGVAWARLAFRASFAGWHAQGIGGFDRERARRVLAIPHDQAIEAVIAIGTPAA